MTYPARTRLWSLIATSDLPSPALTTDFCIVRALADSVRVDARREAAHQLQRLTVSGVGVFSRQSVPGARVITGRDGNTLVLRNGGTFEVLAKNTLDDGFDASPALVDNEMYMRGYRYLYSLGAK